MENKTNTEQRLTFEEKKDCVRDEIEIHVSDRILTGNLLNKFAYPVSWGNEYYSEVYGNNKYEAIEMAINCIAHDWEIEENGK